MRTRDNWTILFILITLMLPLTLDVVSQENGKGGPPPWAPANGYRAKTRHVYFPDYNFYFDVQRSVYIYIEGNNWQVSANIPIMYADIDLRVSAKVELDLNTDSPQKFNADHVAKYKVKVAGGQDQKKSKNTAQGKTK